MRKFVTLLTAALTVLLSCSKGDNDPRLVIITFDGLRWQELFSGADEALVGNPKYVRNPSALQSKYWRDTPEERRSALMPFVWSYVPEHGYLIGNREKTNETTSIPSYEKALIPFSPDMASRAIVYAVAEDDTILDWAPVQLDGIAVITVPEGTRYFIAVVEYRDYYFTDQVGTKYLDQNKTGWSDGSNGNYSVLTAGSGVILDLPEYA